MITATGIAYGSVSGSDAQMKSESPAPPRRADFNWMKPVAILLAVAALLWFSNRARTMVGYVFASAALAVALLVLWDFARRAPHIRRARQRLAGKVVLVYSRRRGWAPLIENNVVPLLEPHAVEVVQYRSRPDRTPRWDMEVIWSNCPRHPNRPSIPFLIRIGTNRQSARIASLRIGLLPFKHCVKRSETTQAAIRPLLEQALIRCDPNQLVSISESPKA